MADSWGNSLVTGGFSGTLTFGSASHKLGGASEGAFVVRLDPKGTLIWAVSAPGAIGRKIGVDGAGGLRVAGRLWTTTASFGSKTLTSQGSDDLFVASLCHGS